MTNELLSILFSIWLSFTCFVIGFLGLYYVLTYFWAKLPRSNQASLTALPRVSILIAAYNEAAIIQKKLENIETLAYPKDLLEVFLIDGGSSDQTSEIARDLQARLSYKMNVITETIRDGKVHSLNRALPKCNGEIVVLSDADSVLDHDSLTNIVSNFADPSVGGVTGYKYPYGSESGKTEKVYRDITNKFRIAESKFYSTFIFQGELSAFRRSLVDEFDENHADDSGTALKVLAKGHRSIEDERAKVYELLPEKGKGVFAMRSRRALNLIGVSLSSLRLFGRGKAKLDVIVLLNFLLHVVVPICSVIVVCLLPVLFIQYPAALLIILFLVLSLAIPSTRRMPTAIYSFLLSQFELLAGLMLYVRGKKLLVWEPSREAQLQRSSPN